MKFLLHWNSYGQAEVEGKGCEEHDLRPIFISIKSFNPLRPNSDLSQTSHFNIKGLSVSEVTRIQNMSTQVKFY